LLGRSAPRGLRVARRIERRWGVPAVFHRADLADFADVRQVADRIARTAGPVDVLINNAGARNDSFLQSPAGLELTFAANHLGHFLLTSLLLDRLAESPAGRIVTVSSGAHADADPAGDWLPAGGAYDRRQAYARSKLANVLFTYELARRLRGTRISANVFAPGGVASRFASNNGFTAWLRHVLAHLRRRDLVPPSVAARDLVRLAMDDALAGVTGRYYERDMPTRSAPGSYDEAAAARLWALSVRLTGLAAANCRAWPLVRPDAEPGA
jgi:NAD(P)-dependent dehydrogenase (short-subunit alcohol dehydrogenase family)